MLSPVAAIFVGIPRSEPGAIPIGGEPLFNPIEALFASVALGFVSLLTGIAELRKFPPRFRLRTLLITMTLIAVMLGLVVWATRQ
jgi:hypothetical protein